jgi:2-oxoglutarate dehydrogenase E1 component
MFTQPLMYKAIKAHGTTLSLYEKRLLEEGSITQAERDAMRQAFDQRLQNALEAASAFKANRADWLDGAWAGFGQAEGEERRGNTAVAIDTLKRVGKALIHTPDNFNLHKTVQRLAQQKNQMLETGEGIDWATAEALAFATLLDEGYHVRLAGQDSSRGTFSQRHAAFIDQETEERYHPLQHVSTAQGEFEVIDSFLSEEAALGFEYGYTLAEPKALVLWEAQFGDFVNGAQVLIDQFITSGERKWLRMSGLVMLLPHGYEGQGPEHSSARLERFLQLCAEDNVQVGNISTPANYFHALRRQIHRNFRKPLILMTPKSLLRHKRCVSSVSELAEGTSFHRLLHDDAQTHPSTTAIKLLPDDQIRRVILCSGKVYYDLFEEREKRGLNDIYLLRVEQFYPYPARSMVAELSRFLKADIVWAQEEPKNMGAWTFIEPHIEWVLNRVGAKHARARYVGRPAAASPAAGLGSRHQAELKALLDEALAP